MYLILYGVEAHKCHYLVSRGATAKTSTEYWKAIERIGANGSPLTLAATCALRISLMEVIDNHIDASNQMWRSKYNI